MKAVSYTRSVPVTDPSSLVDTDLPRPVASGRDLLVRVGAVAVNPVDYKIRQAVAPPKGEEKILGWDAVGEVVAVGEAVSLFQPGELVYYAGDVQRPGSNAEYQLVDERLVGRKPESLSVAEAAALPLTAITAWELLFDHLAIQQRAPGSSLPSDDVLLVVGAAGGVGSILVQLARRLTGATIIATASRPESRAWVERLGAHHVIDHRRPLPAQVEELLKGSDTGPLSHVASLQQTGTYFDAYVEMLRPFGRIAIIDDPEHPLDTARLKPKSLSLHVEFMFARSMFQAPDMARQGQLLNRVAEMTDLGQLQTTVGRHLGTINAENLRAAHAELEAGRVIGKIVLEGF